MKKYPLDITKEDLLRNGLKSITYINEGTPNPRVILDRGEYTEKIIDGEEEISKLIETLKS
jgi:hypothetical protein